MGPFIRINSVKFSILPGEDHELVNEGLYGKALAVSCRQNRRMGIRNFGYMLRGLGRVDRVGGFPLPVWHLYLWVAACAAAAQLHRDLVAIFEADPEVCVLATDLDSPFVT